MQAHFEAPCEINQLNRKKLVYHELWIYKEWILPHPEVQ